jgi:hypothetical protein
MTRSFWILLSTVPAYAHMMSMSSGDLTITGTRAHYELRMPLYEIAHVKDPAEALLANIRFTNAGQPAKLGAHSCREDANTGSYVCAADYEFTAAVDRLDVECTFHNITVPNHVHLLRAEMGGKRDQALFDVSFSRSTLRFTPPSTAEVVATQAGAGFVRALGGAVQILFLAALVIAARSRRELLSLAGMFLAGEAVAVWLVPLTGWQPAPRFVEAAAALTVAYLAVEILMLPQAGARWLVAGFLGVFHGLYFHLFVQTTGYRAPLVMLGAGLAELAAIAVLGLVLSKMSRAVRALRPVQVSASALLAFGMFWFFLRLRS